MSINIQEKINNYVMSHTDLMGKSNQVILSVMMSNGAISRSEYEQACQNSTFGAGFSNTQTMGLSIERSAQTEASQNFVTIGNYQIEYENDKIKSKKSLDGKEQTTFTYQRNDDGVEYVITNTILDDGTEITTTALYANPETGEIKSSDFLSRTTSKPDGSVSIITNDSSINGALREVIVTQDKITTNIYNSADIEKYDNKDSEALNRLAQNIEINGNNYEIKYDGDGNSFVVLQNGDCIEKLIKDFKVTKKQLDELNKSNFDYKHMQVGGIIRIPNEIAADDKSVKNRKTSAEAQQAFFNWSTKHEYADLMTCTFSEHTIKKKHTSVESLAREILPTGTKEQIRTLALRLQMVNPNIVSKLTPGTKITAPLEGDKNAISVAKSAGFSATRENNAFYNILNGLSNTDRQKALSAIQACQKSNIKDLNEIKKRVFEQTGISLFDSGKTIKSGNTARPIELAIQESFDLNIEGIVGHLVYQRLAAIPQENLDKIDINKVKNILGNKAPESLDQIIIAFENAGMSIMTADEIKDNALKFEGNELIMPDLKKLRAQNFAAQVIASQYDQGIAILQQYKDNNGMVAKLYEGFATGIDKTFNCERAHSATVYIEHLKKEKETLLKMLEDNKLSADSNYQKAFYQATGINFNENNIQAFIDLASKQVDPNSQEFQSAYQKAFGSRHVDNTSSFVESKAFWAGCGNMTLMIYAMMNPLARSVTGGIAGGLAKAGVGTLTSNALANAAIMGSSTALVEGLDLAIKDAPISSTDISNYIQSIGISTGFGAFAGYMAPTFQKVCATVSSKAASKFPQLFKNPDVKKLETVTKSLESGKTISGTELMANYLTTPGTNIAGKSAEFLAEIVAFTGYSVPAGMIAKFTALVFDKDGTLKEQYNNEESLFEIIKQEFGHQIQGLTSCKGLTKILMAFCSKKNVNAAMMQEKLSGFETLKNIEFKYTEINGQKILIAKTPKGNYKVNSLSEAVKLCENVSMVESAILMDKSLQEKNSETQTVEEKDPAILNEVTKIIERYSTSKASLDKLLEDAGLKDIGEMSSRVKSEQSLYDKIKNYLNDNPNATLEEAVKSVRDAFGARTVVASQDFTTHPEVKALMEAGDIKGAQLRAAELQSAPALEKLKGMILNQAQGKDGLETARISNYVSENGIPYFSEAQLAELKQFGAQHGVNIDYVVKVDKSDPLYAQMKAEGKKPTTKAQPSGYTALQINFKTKTGEIMEWQFRGEKVNEFAEGEHIPYDLRTNKDIIGDHKELEPLYEPIKELLSEKVMSEENYAEYNRYLTDYYSHLRKLELGFETTEPQLEDYGNGYKFDPRLKAKNLVTLHEYADKLKKGEISQEEALQKYNEKISFDQTPTADIENTAKVRPQAAAFLKSATQTQTLIDTYAKNPNLAFNKLDAATQNILIDKIIATDTPTTKSQNALYKLLAEHIDSSEVINKICSDDNLCNKLIQNYASLEPIFAHQTNINPRLKKFIQLNLSLMKEFNPEGFKELTHSKGFKEIKSGNMSYKLLERLRFDEKIDDNYFYKLFEGLETRADQLLQRPELSSYDPNLVKQFIEIDPSRQDEILCILGNAKDKAYMDKMLKFLVQRSNIMEQNIENANKQGNIVSPKEIQTSQNARINLLKIAAINPNITAMATSFSARNASIVGINLLAEQVLKCKFLGKERDNLCRKLLENNKILNTNDAISAIKFAERFDSIDQMFAVLEHFKQFGKVNFASIFNGITENNIDYVMKNIGPGRFKPHVVELLYAVKDMPEFKLEANQGKILEALGQITEDTGLKMYQVTKLVDMKLNNPAQYDKIAESGIFELVKSGRLDAQVIKLLNSNSDLSQDMYNDLKLLQSGKSIVPEFKEGTPIAEAFAQTKCGDAVEIGDKMFINDGNSLVEWNMTKAHFFELFPPVKRFASVQGTIGDCYLISSLSSCMHNPQTRAEIYKLFSVNGNDVTVTIKGYEDFNGSETYPNMRIELSKSGRMNMIGCKGLQMLERTYAKTALRPATKDFLPSLEVSPSSLMTRIPGGYAPTALSEILGYNSAGSQNDIPLGGLPKGTTIGINVNKNQAAIENYLNNFANNENYILNFGTIAGKSTESKLLPEYNLVSNHAYSIIGYNPATKTVTIANPHSFSTTTEIPVEILSKYVHHFDITHLK